MKETELERAEREWDVVDASHRSVLKERWDKRASEWEEGLRNDEIRRVYYDKRIEATIGWLQSFGLFQGSCDIADVGCGPGRFVAEFAKKSRYVLGVDISPQMAEYGSAYSKELGLDNADFYTGDFSKLDIKSLGWQNRFDLAFSSITPAIRGKNGLDNLISMSRAWCFNSCFIYFYNELHDRILKDLFQLPPRREKTSHSYWFKQLFDLLWLRGYQPHVHYYTDHREESRSVDRRFAEDLTNYLLDEEASAENIESVLGYLEQNANENGKISFISECRYGWLLWNVNDRIGR